MVTNDYLGKNEPGKAADTIGNAADEVKSQPFYMVATGKLLLQQGRTDEAMKLFDEAATRNKKKNIEVMAAIAEALISSESGDASRALTIPEKLIKKARKNSNLYIQAGDAQRKLADGTEAFKAYQKAAEINVHDPEPLYKIG